VIALWLGHESVDTTEGYLHAVMAMKEQALAKAAPIKRNATVTDPKITCSPF
jgi:integrase